MAKDINDKEKPNQDNPDDLLSALPQPFKFIAGVLHELLDKVSRPIQTIVAILFTITIIIFAFGAMKGLFGIDFFSWLGPDSKNYSHFVSGDIVMKDKYKWSPIDSDIEFTSSKMLYTRKEFMDLGYFKLSWIMRVPENELESGEIDLAVKKNSQSSLIDFIGTSQIKYSLLYDQSKPYRWIHLEIDTTKNENNIMISDSLTAK